MQYTNVLTHEHTRVLTHKHTRVHNILCLGYGMVHLCQVGWILEYLGATPLCACKVTWERSRPNTVGRRVRKFAEHPPPRPIHLPLLCDRGVISASCSGHCSFQQIHDDALQCKSLLLSVSKQHQEKQLVQVGQMCFYS